MAEDRLVAGGALIEDADAKLRPQRLTDFIGQKQLCENLSVFIAAASGRQ